MSEENVEIVRQTLEVFDRRNRAAWIALREEDCEVVTDRNWPEAEPICGADAAWRFYIAVFEAFEQVSIGGAELVDAGTDKVLIHHRHDARGSASGAYVEINYWALLTLRNGRVVRDEWFADQGEALEAAGLSE